MSSPGPQIFTTREALLKTINNDQATCRWFTFLVTQDNVRKEFHDDPAIGRTYQVLTRIRAGQRILYASLFIYLLPVILADQYLLLAGLPFFLLMGIRWLKRQKECVMAIAGSLVDHDFPGETLHAKTLYQLGEFYSREYSVPSLVDAIHAQDKVSRRTVILTLGILLILSPLPITVPQIIAATIGVFLIAFGIFNTPVVYKHIK